MPSLSGKSVPHPEHFQFEDRRFKPYGLCRRLAFSLFQGKNALETLPSIQNPPPAQDS